VVVELVAVDAEVYLLRANVSFNGFPIPPDEIRCFTSPSQPGGYIYLAKKCEPALTTQHFKVLRADENQWIIKNDYLGLCPIFDKVDGDILSALCDPTDLKQLWIKLAY